MHRRRSAIHSGGTTELTALNYIMTGRKHGLDPLDLLTQLFNGRPLAIPAAGTA